MSAAGSACGTVSIVIPALNEAARIAATVRHALAAHADEVIVADGGSDDDTCEQAARAGARVIECPRGRGIQLRAGAGAARGDLIAFLHADAVLPCEGAAAIRVTLAKPGVAAGAFSLAIDSAGRAYRMLERTIAWRSRRFGFSYGDQCIFVRRAVLERVGGVPALPVMEDFELVRRLRRIGRIEVRPERVLVSARRWQRHGIVRTTLLNQACIAAYLLRVEPARIARWRDGGRSAGERATAPALS